MSRLCLLNCVLACEPPANELLAMRSSDPLMKIDAALRHFVGARSPVNGTG
jgi:hypothetical protein